MSLLKNASVYFFMVKSPLKLTDTQAFCGWAASNPIYTLKLYLKMESFCLRLPIS
jgi:hypothetical protein